MASYIDTDELESTAPVPTSEAQGQKGVKFLAKCALYDAAEEGRPFALYP